MFRQRVSIAVVVTVALVAAATVLLGAFGLFSYRTTRDQQRLALRSDQRILADQLAVGLALPIWNFDRDQIDRIVDGGMRDQDVAAIVVRLTDRHNSVQARTRDAQWRPQIADENVSTAGLIVERRRITAGDADVGTVDVFVTPRFVDAELSRARLTILAEALAFDAVLVLVLGSLLWWQVLRPLKLVELYAAAVRSGERPQAGLEGRRFRGELESLRASVEAMITLLDARYAALRGSEGRLSASEEKFRSAMEHSPVGMGIVDPEGRWVEANPALCDIVGYDADQLRTMTFQDITHPDDLPQDTQAMRQLLDRQIDTYQSEKRYIHRDGHPVWIQIYVSLVLDESGRPRSFVVQVQDITERKRSAADLVALNTRYARHQAALTVLTRTYVRDADDLLPVLQQITEVVAMTLDVARVSIWRLTDNGQSLVCEDLFELVEKRHASGAHVTAQNYPALFDDDADTDVVALRDPADDANFAAFARAHLRPLGIVSMMHAQIRAQGVRIGVLACAHKGPSRTWTPDEQTFVSAVSNLISAQMAQIERERAEAQLRQAHKMEAIGQLAGGVAHDFNNILTVILGKAATIAVDERLPEDLRHAATDIVDGGDRAAALTRQLLMFSRRQTVQMREVDLNDAVANLARMLKRIVGEDVPVEVWYAPRPLYVKADVGMIDQVLLNLAVNARDAMPGGGHIRIQTSEVELDSAAVVRRGKGRPGSFVCLHVTDSGSGIKPEHLPHIFEPFFTTKDVGRGTGLGLATTYGIVLQHDGWIEVDSELGSGTTFRVFLPRIASAPAMLHVLNVPPASVQGSETILVVEDEQDVRTLVRESLEGYGYNVLEAANGPQALEVWQSHSGAIDLVVTDMTMPDGITGLDLLRQLRERAPALKAIFMSGYFADVSSAEVTLGDEASFYLAKPFSLAELAKTVRQCMDAGGASSQHHVPVDR